MKCYNIIERILGEYGPVVWDNSKLYMGTARKKKEKKKKKKKRKVLRIWQISFDFYHVIYKP